MNWTCRCKCGKVFNVLGCALKNKQTKSCGCLKNELLSKRTWKGFQEISGVYWTRLQTDAKSRRFAWKVTSQYIWDLYLQQNRKCALTGLPIAFERNFKKYGSERQTASLDRIDSKLGYVVGNVQWVHKDINKLKWDWSLDKLYEMCSLLLSNKETCFSKTRTSNGSEN